jgi:hypothetical protein
MAALRAVSERAQLPPEVDTRTAGFIYAARTGFCTSGC